MRAAVAALFLLAACGGGQPTIIDGTSKETFERTAAAARRDLPDADRLAYDAALKNPPGARYGDTQVEKDELAREAYHGMTASQVVAADR
jgi:hypothetical protein